MAIYWWFRTVTLYSFPSVWSHYVVCVVLNVYTQSTNNNTETWKLCTQNWFSPFWFCLTCIITLIMKTKTYKNYCTWYSLFSHLLSCVVCFLGNLVCFTYLFRCNVTHQMTKCKYNIYCSNEKLKNVQSKSLVTFCKQ